MPKILIWSKMDWSGRQTHHQHPDELVNWYPNTADWCMYSTRQVGLMLWLNSPSASYWSQWACMLLTAVDYVVAFRNKPQWWRNHRRHQLTSSRVREAVLRITAVHVAAELWSKLPFFPFLIPVHSVLHFHSLIQTWRTLKSRWNRALKTLYISLHVQNTECSDQLKL